MSKVKDLVATAANSAPLAPLTHLYQAARTERENLRNGCPAKDMQVIGVTGTTGKTTTTTILYSILKAAGKNAGYYTTVEYNVGNGTEFNATRMTTVPAGVLFKNLARAKANGIDTFVLETTSHALQQRRTVGIPYTAAILTNMSHEHLDYHKTFAAYVKAKLRLFDLTRRNPNGKGLAVINADDAVAAEFIEHSRQSITYGLKAGDVRAKNIKLTPSGSTFTVVWGKEKFDVTTHLPGEFNIYNVLAATTMALGLGIEPSAIQQGLATLDGVPGRMHVLKSGFGFDIVIDFAHTPESFKKIFEVFRPLVKGKLIVVFGRAGRRDKPSRGIQGGLAGEYCDTIILTEDDPRDEDNRIIMEEIAVEARKRGKKDGEDLFMVDLREDAIQKAVDMAGKGDLILLLSKGHERTIEYADGPKKWNEQKAAEKALAKRAKTTK